MKKVAWIFISLVFLSALSLWLWLPSEKAIKGCIKTSMYGVDLCPALNNYVPLKQISKHVQDAILLTEDSSFYSHNGFDQEGIERCYEKFKQTFFLQYVIKTSLMFGCTAS